MTQQEKIQSSQRAYILTLAKSGTQARFAVYLDNGEGLKVLWPYGDDTAHLLPYQIHSLVMNYPAYHFIVRGYNYSKVGVIKKMLNDINPELAIYQLEGGIPS